MYPVSLTDCLFFPIYCKFEQEFQLLEINNLGVNQRFYIFSLFMHNITFKVGFLATGPSRTTNTDIINENKNALIVILPTICAKGIHWSRVSTNLNFKQISSFTQMERCSFWSCHVIMAIQQTKCFPVKRKSIVLKQAIMMEKKKKSQESGHKPWLSRICNQCKETFQK